MFDIFELLGIEKSLASGKMYKAFQVPFRSGIGCL